MMTTALHAEIMRLIREEFDPHPNCELPAGEWDDNAEDVADKIILAALASPLHVSVAWNAYSAYSRAFNRLRQEIEP